MKIRFILLLTILLGFTLSCKTDNSKKEETTTTEIRQWKPEDTRAITAVSVKRGLTIKTDHATDGYVLFQPSKSTETYLMNTDGEVVHTWKGKLNVLHSYLLENGHLFRLERDPDFPVFAAGGQSGRITEYDWDGNLLWDFKYANENELTHHDFEIMPNGNILAIAYEVKSVEEAIAAGMDPNHIPKAGIWPDKIVEIKPTRPNGGEIVWEWHMWDHIIQELDSTKANYGVVSDNPGKIHINTHSEGGPPMTQEQINGMKHLGFMTSNATLENLGSDLAHFNAIGYNADLDQIIFSSPHLNEIFIIDHSISTEEAKGPAGDLLYRWGNPANYNRGTKEDQKLFGQHDVKWIPKGYPGEGNIIVYNNDIPDPNNKMPNIFVAVLQSQSPDPQISIEDIGNYSAVYEITPPEGYSISENGAFGPDSPTWIHTAPDKYSLYSAFVSGAQRLKNGNTLVTEGAKGRFLEVTSSGETVWEYWNPYMHDYKLPDGSHSQPMGSFIFAQFRGTHFTPDFPAFNGKELKAITPQPKEFVFKMPPPPPTENDSIH